MSRTCLSILLVLCLTWLVFLSILTSSIPAVKASGSIYIRVDGSVDPPTAPIQRSGDVYSLTGNITSDANAIRIERNNMTIDGQGYTMQGPGPSGGFGFLLNNTGNVTIRNTNIRSFYIGIKISWLTNNSKIIGNNITENSDGIQILESSSNTTISGNTLKDNINSGVWIENSSNNNTISENSLTNNGHGVMLKMSNYNTVSKNNITGGYGVGLDRAFSNSVSENNVSGSPYGIMLVESSTYNTVSRNNINGSIWIGVRLYEGSESNDIFDNNITNSGIGVGLERGCPSNRIIGNDIAFNAKGISIDDSSNNQIYHNRIRNNTDQVDTDQSVNVWDNDFPSGGNYWSDYTDADKYSNATEIDASGLWNTPYVIETGNKDNYPLIPEFSSFLILPLFTMATLLAVILYKRRNAVC